MFSPLVSKMSKDKDNKDTTKFKEMNGTTVLDLTNVELEQTMNNSADEVCKNRKTADHHQIFLKDNA